MTRNQLLFLLVVLALIGGAGLVLLHRDKESWAEPKAKLGDKLLPHFQPNDVAAIRIKGDSELNLVRKNNVWRVQERGDYPANFGQISDVLIKLRDLKVVEAETVDASELSRVDLDEPGRGSNSGTQVEFMDGQGKLIEALRLGKKHIRESSPSPFGNGSPDGRYLLLPNDPKNVFLISDALSSLQPAPESWLNKDFFKVEKMKSVALSASNAANSWKLARETESSPWALVDTQPGEVLDANKISATARILDYPAFADVIASNTASTATGLDNSKVLTIETFDRFSYTLKIGAKSPADAYPVTVAVAAEIPTERVAGKDETTDDKKKLDQEFLDKTRKLRDKFKQEQALAPWVYMVNSWILDPLLRDRAQLLVAKKAEQTEGSAAAVAKPGPTTAVPVVTPN